MSMEKSLRLFAAWFAEELLVELLDIWILVALADCFLSVGVVESFATFSEDLAVSAVVRLATTVDTAAWASHNFDSVEVAFAFANEVNEFLSVSKTVSDTEFNRGTVEVDSSDAYAFETADSLEVNFAERLLSEDFVCSTCCSLDNTTGNAEDYCCTCRLAEWAVELSLWERVEVDVVLADEASELASGD